MSDHQPFSTVKKDDVEQSDPQPATYYHLARAVLLREFLLFVRYPANAIGGVVVALFFFIVLFYGGQLLAGRALADSIEGIVVGYFLWTLSSGAYSSISNDIGSEVQWGTLERHVTTPFGFAPVALLKVPYLSSDSRWDVAGDRNETRIPSGHSRNRCRSECCVGAWAWIRCWRNHGLI
jgi:ABC-2 type transport system permease protein